MSRKLWLLALLLPAGVIGCHHAKSQSEEARSPEVMVSLPIKDDIVDFETFTGRTEPVNHVDLKARVSGYLDKVYVGRQGEVEDDKQVPFYEGEDVRKGDVLFVIQRKPFQDALTQAQKNLEGLIVQRDNNKRVKDRAEAGGAGVSPNDLDAAITAYRMSESQVGSAAAAVEIAKQNLEWATIRAPFDGRIGKRLVDHGNVVKADDTILASIEQINPLHAYFDVDERTTLRINPLLHNGMVPDNAAKKFPLALGLANEDPDKYVHAGTLKFADNKVDASTGTLRMWGLFENPNLDLKSGMFVRVRMGIGEPQKELFIAEAALNSDQGRKYVYVLDDENKIVYTPVETGQRKDGRIAIRSGLKENDRVVVDGLQRVRPQMVVNPKEVTMPRAKDDELH
jgi:RND family efflux transporter MFP subunit